MEAQTDDRTDARIIAHLRFARTIATRAIDPRCRGADRDDLIAWGMVGLVQAAKRFRDDQGATFASYAARRVRGQVLDALRVSDPLTRSARRAFREARAADPEVPAPFSEVSLDRYTAAGREVPAAGLCRTQQDARWASVAGAMRGLPPLERRVLQLSFGRGLTLREIGARVGLSESGVCRLRARALRRLRTRCTAA
ncbi:MAG: sigma-70 family RNA polymerase sigma factor [Chloroflexota bacterium]|nr:sigma-70 family RNA polymerase sigma factor [Chloroflexota bacterium]